MKPQPSPLLPGDTVRRNGETHVVLAVGREFCFVGYVLVSGLAGWRLATEFEKVTR